jgi:hypothetical protein
LQNVGIAERPVFFSDVMSGLENHLHLHQQGAKMNNTTAAHPIFTGDSGLGGSALRNSPVTSLRIAANRPAVPLPTNGQNMVRIPADRLMVSSSPTSRTMSSMSGTVQQQSLIGAGPSKISAGSATFLDPLGGLANQQQHMLAASQSAASISAASQQRYQELLSQRVLNNQRLAAAAGEFSTAVQQTPTRPASVQPPGVGSAYRSAAERMGVVQTLPRNPTTGHQQQQQQHQQFSNQE